MKIKASNLNLSVSQAFELTLQDDGGAAVAIKVEFWQGETKVKELFYTNTQTPKPKSVQLAPGAYDLFVTIAASKTKKTLGPTYDSSVTLTDQGIATMICTAKGSVPEGKPLDADAELFNVTVA